MRPNSGLAAYHPLVTSRGFDPAQTDISLRNDTANLVKAGFNVYGRLYLKTLDAFLSCSSRSELSFESSAVSRNGSAGVQHCRPHGGQKVGHYRCRLGH